VPLGLGDLVGSASAYSSTKYRADGDLYFDSFEAIKVSVSASGLGPSF